MHVLFATSIISLSPELTFEDIECCGCALQGAFEGNRLEFVAKEFLLKPPIQFFRGLDVLEMSVKCVSSAPSRHCRTHVPAEVQPGSLIDCRGAGAK